MAKNWLTSHPILARFAAIRIIDLEAEVAERFEFNPAKIRAAIDAGPPRCRSRTGRAGAAVELSDRFGPIAALNSIVIPAKAGISPVRQTVRMRSCFRVTCL